MRATRAFIHLDNFRANIAAIRQRAGSRPLLCVPLKADAYGHGAVPLARTALEEGAAFLAVAAVSEAEELRAGGIGAPILLLSLPLPEELPALPALRLSPFVADRETIDALEETAAGGPPLGVHLKIDTGMARIGCPPEEALALARHLARQKHLFLEGMATHLAVSDSPLPEDLAYTREQLDRFQEAVRAVRGAGIDPGLLHGANSGALLFHPQASLDMIRPGIALYGYSPPSGAAQALPVQPVMELCSAVSYLKRVRKGQTVSYGRTWTAPEDTLIATIPAGYGDGLPRALSGTGFSVLVGDTPCPLAGRICMDQFMVDLGPDSAVRRWDPVRIFGPGGTDAADIARLTGTIPYEITCGISKRVPRVYLP